jgi:replicative DNA helicase
MVVKMIKNNYGRKLSDPRWQRKRLEIFQRDNWTCQDCGDSETELQVHHKQYKGDPWNAPDDTLVTLCANCHERISPIDGEISIRNLLARGVDAMEKKLVPEFSGIGAGIETFDVAFGGFYPGLTVVAGRPSMGLTSFAINIAIESAVKQKRVGYFLTEFSPSVFSSRLISSLGRVPFEHIEPRSRIQDDEWPRVTSSISILAESNLRVLEASTKRASSVVRVMERWADDGLDVLVVDSLEALTAGNGGKLYDESLADVAAELHGAALSLGLPVVALVGLPRQLEVRPNKRPILSDFGRAERLLRFTDMVVFLYRDEVYHPDSEDRGLGEIIVPKNNHGPSATVRAAFLDTYRRWEEMVGEF